MIGCTRRCLARSELHLAEDFRVFACEYRDFCAVGHEAAMFVLFVMKHIREK